MRARPDSVNRPLGSVGAVRRISAGRYSAIVLAAGLSLALIVLSGAAVRLTQAGLGCEDWPTCNGGEIAPEWELHGWIEFGNRLISLAVSVACIVAVLAAYRHEHRRRDLVAWAWGLVAGVVAQILLGGATVLLDLHPAVVGGHFILSMVLLWNVAVLWVRSTAPGPDSRPAVVASTLQHSRIVVALSGLVLLTGVVVTGTGPNSGDSRADRLPFELTDVARIHSVSVWIFVAGLVALAIRLRGGGTGAERWSRIVLAVAVAQGAVGYTQFALGVPPLLVELHVLGATATWTLMVVLHLHLFDRTAGAAQGSQADSSAPAGLNRPQRPNEGSVVVETSAVLPE